MKFRLLVDMEVFEFLKTLRRDEQRVLQLRLRQLQEFPAGFSDYHEYAPTGQRVDISICDRFAVNYAVDHLDRQVKILVITLADKNR